MLMDEFISDKQVISANCRQSYGGQATPVSAMRFIDVWPEESFC